MQFDPEQVRQLNDHGFVAAYVGDVGCGDVIVVPKRNRPEYGPIRYTRPRENTTEFYILGVKRVKFFPGNEDSYGSVDLVGYNADGLEVHESWGTHQACYLKTIHSLSDLVSRDAAIIGGALLSLKED